MLRLISGVVPPWTPAPSISPNMTNLKSQLYEKSINDSLRCFEEFLLEEDLHNANFCLQTWRMHSKELGTYDQDEYEVFKKKLADAKAAKASRTGKAINK